MSIFPLNSADFGSYIARMDINETKAENESLKSQLMTSSMTNELTRVLHACDTSDRLMKTLLVGISEITGLERSIFFKVDKNSFSLIPTHSRGVPQETLGGFSCSLGFAGGDITDCVFLNKHLLVNGISPIDDTFAERLGSKEYLVIPVVGRIGSLMSQQEEKPPESKPVSEDERRRQRVESPAFRTIGVLWIDCGSADRNMTGDDIGTISVIVTQAGVIIENMRMYSELIDANDSLKEAYDELKVVNHELSEANAKINRDMEHARAVQEGLLPETLPNSSDLDIGAMYVPADAVGGDYYDVFEISHGVFGVIIADVSGHGISSALVMSTVKVLLKMHASAATGPQKTLEAVNRLFQTEIRTTNFVTIFYGIFNTAEHVFTFTSAGHCPVVFMDRETGECSTVKADGLFLGVFPDMMLSENVLNYKPGTQRLVLYTDGLTEARNPETDEMFELHRLIESVKKTNALPPSDALTKIVEMQKEFCGPAAVAEDDITMLVIDY